jgi:hypothetical protein
MKIDLTQKVLDTLGKPIVPEATLGNVLSSQLAGATTGDSLKLWGWAEKLARALPIELDDSDLITLTDFVKNHTSMTVLAKAQLLKAFIAQGKT